ncbi:MAG TPA: glycosyltransferase, partial [Acidimicrobiia bacterium]|nr:glycosyltransferase [Acidimicrobiia bacterium]
RFRRWSTRTFRSIMNRADICLLPISLNPFTACKTSNRVVTSLTLGVPVVADLIPSYEEFVPYILVSNWEQHLERYASSRELRQQHVREGQEFIARRFAPEAIAEQWTSVFRRVVGEAASSGKSRSGDL